MINETTMIRTRTIEYIGRKREEKTLKIISKFLHFKINTTSSRCLLVQILHDNNSKAVGCSDFEITKDICVSPSRVSYGMYIVMYDYFMTGYFMTAQTRGGVEGDVAALMSQYIEVPTRYCLVFDLFLMEDPFSTEDALRIYFRPGGQERTMPYLLYEYLEWTDSTWTREKLTLPPGKYQLLFMYTMGFPYASATAIDNVDIEPCSHTPGLQGIGQREWSVGKFTGPSKSVETKLNTDMLLMPPPLGAEGIILLGCSPARLSDHLWMAFVKFGISRERMEGMAWNLACWFETSRDSTFRYNHTYMGGYTNMTIKSGTAFIPRSGPTFTNMV